MTVPIISLRLEGKKGGKGRLSKVPRVDLFYATELYYVDGVGEEKRRANDHVATGADLVSLHQFLSKEPLRVKRTHALWWGERKGLRQRRSPFHRSRSQARIDKREKRGEEEVQLELATGHGP